MVKLHWLQQYFNRCQEHGHRNQGDQMARLKGDALVLGFFFYTFQDYLSVCVICLQNDCCLRLYCIVAFEEGRTLCLEMSPGSWKGKGCLCLGMKWREAKGVLWCTCSQKATHGNNPSQRHTLDEVVPTRLHVNHRQHRWTSGQKNTFS